MLRRFRRVQRFRNIERAQEAVPRRIVADRSNPFQYLTKVEFRAHFRLSKEAVVDLLQIIGDQLADPEQNRTHS